MFPTAVFQNVRLVGFRRRHFEYYRGQNYRKKNRNFSFKDCVRGEEFEF